MSTESWKCPFCQQLNSSWSTNCGRCEKARGEQRFSLPVIQIVVRGDNHFDVILREHVAQGLIWDEMLAEISRITSGQKPRYMCHIETLLDRILWRRRKNESAQLTVTDARPPKGAPPGGDQHG